MLLVTRPRRIITRLGLLLLLNLFIVNQLRAPIITSAVFPVKCVANINLVKTETFFCFSNQYVRANIFHWFIKISCRWRYSPSRESFNRCSSRGRCDRRSSRDMLLFCRLLVVHLVAVCFHLACFSPAEGGGCLRTLSFILFTCFCCCYSP